MPEALQPAGFAALANWNDQSAKRILPAFQRQARAILAAGSGFRSDTRFGGTRDDWLIACRNAPSRAATPARQFFEAHFRPFTVSDPVNAEGLFTGYYEPLVMASRRRHGVFQVPIYARPPELENFSEAEKAATGLSSGWRDGLKLMPFATRQEIEQGSLAGRGLEICWATSWVDVFFLHIQGQGRVYLEDGSEIFLSFAAKSGRPYQSIGAAAIANGLIPEPEMSMQALRGWMNQNPAEARALMWQNPSYIFFRETPPPPAGLGGVGAGKVNLEPMVSLAVDRSYWAFGTPFLLETKPQTTPGAELPALSLPVIAQDTGSAIRGMARGDLFWGAGEDAACNAGHMKAAGRLTVLLPIPVAQRLGLAA